MIAPDEITHLAFIEQKLDAALNAANANVSRIDQEYRNARYYMADYRGEIDPHEMFQNELALKQIDHTGAFAVGIWDKLTKLKESRNESHASANPIITWHPIPISAK